MSSETYCYCELVHISVCDGKNFNNVLKISGTFTPILVDWLMCPGSVHRSFKVCSDVMKHQKMFMKFCVKLERMMKVCKVTEIIKIFQKSPVQAEKVN